MTQTAPFCATLICLTGEEVQSLEKTCGYEFSLADVHHHMCCCEGRKGRTLGHRKAEAIGGNCPTSWQGLRAVLRFPQPSCCPNPPPHFHKRSFWRNRGSRKRAFASITTGFRPSFLLLASLFMLVRCFLEPLIRRKTVCRPLGPLALQRP